MQAFSFANGRPSTGSTVNILTEGPRIDNDVFLINSDNENTDRFARAGDQVDIAIVFDDDITLPAAGDLLFNGNPASFVAPIGGAGNILRANYTIASSDTDGPLPLSFTIADPAGNTRVFTQDSISGDGNVIIDNTGPEFVASSARLVANTTTSASFIFSFNEPVNLSDPSVISDLTVDIIPDGTSPTAVTTGTNLTTILVTWNHYTDSK